LLKVIEPYIKSLGIWDGQNLRSDEVVEAILNGISFRRPLPRLLKTDNGSEFAVKIPDKWLYKRGVYDFSRPGTPSGLVLYRVAIAQAPRFAELGRQLSKAGPKAFTAVVVDRLNDALQTGEIDVQTIGVEDAAALLIIMVRGEGHMEILTHPE
jgi:hypothetical protein